MKYKGAIIRSIWMIVFLTLSYFCVLTFIAAQANREKADDAFNESFYMLNDVMNVEEMVFEDGSKEHLSVWHKDNFLAIGFTGIHDLPFIAMFAFLLTSNLYLWLRKA